MQRRAVPLAVSIVVCLGLVDACVEPTEPALSSINANHICCGAGIVTPLYADGRWTKVSARPLATNAPYDFRLIMTHPYDQVLAPGEWSFPGGTSVEFVVVGCDLVHRDLCFTARQGPPPAAYQNDSAGVVVTGAELTTGFECGECDDFIWELRSTPVPPPDTLVLEIKPARREFTPVMAGCFNAVMQSAYHCVVKDSGKVDSTSSGYGPAKRPDTVTVRIRTYFKSTGLPAPGATVRIVTAPRYGTGGHNHSPSDRPGGTFFSRAQRDSVDTSYAGTRNQIRFEMPEPGDTTVIYRTSGISGIDFLSGGASLGLQNVGGYDSVLVRIKNLEPLANGGNIQLIGTDDRHPASLRYYGTAEMLAAVRGLANELQLQADKINALPPGQRPPGQFPRVLQVNDMSLPWGGLFEIPSSPAWAHPHKNHRTGTSADIDVQNGPAGESYYLAVRAIWQRSSGHLPGDERATANHVHLEY